MDILQHAASVHFSNYALSHITVVHYIELKREKNRRKVLPPFHIVKVNMFLDTRQNCCCVYKRGTIGNGVNTSLFVEGVLSIITSLGAVNTSAFSFNTPPVQK